MIKNISDKAVIIRWDGKERTLQPNEMLDIRDMNVAHEQVALTEGKIGSKLTGLVVLVHTKTELLGREDIRKQQAEIDRKEAEIAAREKALAEREAAAQASSKGKGKKTAEE